MVYQIIQKRIFVLVIPGRYSYDCVFYYLELKGGKVITAGVDTGWCKNYRDRALVDSWN